MKIIKPYAEFARIVDGGNILRNVELYGRVCYKSEDRITLDSAKGFVEKIIERGHEAVLEHEKFTVRFVCDRGVSHELVRHRIASFCQESTRYCNYGNSDGGCTFIKPSFFEADLSRYAEWEDAMYQAEQHYLALLRMGASPQEARSVLPNSLKTEVVMTANLREWRHFFKLRTATAAHPQMRELTIPLLMELKKRIPVVFDDIEVVVQCTEK